MEYCNIFIVVITGMILGSFASMCIYRIPRKEDIIFKRSHCTSCGMELKAEDLIPIVSFLINRGKCRYCKEKVDSAYLLIEIISLIISVIIYKLYGLNIEYFLLMVIMTILLIISFIDLKHLIIPDMLVLSILISALIKMVYVFRYYDLDYYISQSIKGFIFILVTYLIIYTLSKGSLGHGDIKLSLALSFLFSLRESVNSFLTAYIIAAFVSVTLIVFKKKKLKSVIPFGPFISVSFFIVGVLKYYLI